jgi:anti-sigma28 factor (negative regulator of flagellin synthesis)
MKGPHPGEDGARRPIIRRAADPTRVDVRPRTSGSIQPDLSSADRSPVIDPISTSQGRRNEMRMNQLQQLIDRGEYRVDTHAVADAIVRRLLAGHGQTQAPPAVEHDG